MSIIKILLITLLVNACQSNSIEKAPRTINTVTKSGSFSDYKDYIQRLELSLNVEPEHSSRFLLHKNSNNKIMKVKNVTVVLHGLSLSPQWMQELSEKFYKRGHNVINLRLAKHFETPRRKLDEIKYEEWVEQMRLLVPYLHLIGQQVTFVGHSTGALMALQAAVENLIPTSKIILLSPALRLSILTRGGTKALRAVGLSGYLMDNIKGAFTVKSKKYDSAYAEVQVRNLSSFLHEDILKYNSKDKSFEPPKVSELMNDTSILVLDTQSDIVVDIETNQTFFSKLKNTQYKVIPLTSALAHNKIMFLENSNDQSDTLTHKYINDFLNRKN